jgi:AGZA family xanthine/uracil permease-like MFS transporter
MQSVTSTRNAAPAGLDAFFKISQRGSTLGREIRGGIVTFLTMAYIIVLNPIILLQGQDTDGASLGSFEQIAAATALAAGVLTILMGVVANYPLALATGLGLNAFVTFSIASQMTWADAMGLVVIEGLVILVLVLTGFREAVFRAVPAQLKIAISVGIGLFIALIGLVGGGFVRRHSAGPVPVELGVGGQLEGWPVVVFGFGLVLVIALYVARVRAAILVSIVATTLVAILVERLADIGPAVTGVDDDGNPVVNPTGWNLNVPAWPDAVVARPDFGLVGQFNLLGSWENAGIVTVALFVFTLMLADFFDTMGTMTAIGAEAGLLDDEGNPPNIKRILVVDSVAAAAGGAAGVSSNTSYIESASGVAEGARTGLASVVTGLLFLLATLFAPLVTVIPNEAAVPALVLVGFLMMQQVRGIDWDDLEIAVPAFLTIVLMPFTYSIAVGIGGGFVAFVLIKVVRGKLGAVHPLMWVVAALFVVYFAISPVSSWIS